MSYFHDFGDEDNDRCLRCGVRYARRAACKPRWVRILDVIRAEREENAELKAEIKDLNDQMDKDGEVVNAAQDLIALMKEALGHEDVFSEGHDLFQIRRQLEKAQDALEKAR